jgi:hypothetical protein
MELSPIQATSCSADEECQSTFMRPNGSLPCSQEPATLFYPEPNESSPHSPIVFKISLNITLPSISRAFNWGLPTQTPYTLLCYSIRAICPTHLILLGLIILTIFGEEQEL